MKTLFNYTILIMLLVAKVGYAQCEVPESEREALMVLFDTAEGDNWTNNENWDTRSPVCDWYGVTVENGHVTELRLSNNNLKGGIDVLLFRNLRYLTHIELRAPASTTPTDNGLSAENLLFNICSPRNGLSSLKYLDLSGVVLNEVVPKGNTLIDQPNISVLASLEHLNLSNTKLTGALQGGDFRKLRDLKVLNLGSLDDHINTNNLSANDFLKTIVPSGRNGLGLSSLQTLNLNGVKLNEEIPQEDAVADGATISSLSRLQSLSLSNTGLVGNIPEDITLLTNLQTLNLSKNNLSDNIPDLSFIGRNHPRNWRLNISGNYFHFIDFEDEHPTYIGFAGERYFYAYAPQAKIDSEETILLVPMQPYTMSINLESVNNSYQWYKNGVAIAGATNKEYTLTNLSALDAGTYHCVTTNSIFMTDGIPDLILERHPIHLVVRPANQFCTAEIGREPVVADLIPNGTNIQWFLEETGGEPLAGDFELSDVYDAGGTSFWWDDITDGNTIRTEAIILIDEVTIPGSEEFEYQTFGPSENPTVADLQMPGTNIVWYDDVNASVALTPDTPLMHNTLYYAEEAGITKCRLAVSVFIGILPPEADTVQNLCAGQTVSAIQVTLGDPSMQARWYTVETGGEPLSADWPLQSNIVYYVSQVDSSGNESEERAPVLVFLETVEPPIVSPSGTQTFYSNQSQLVANLFALGNNIQWFTQPTGGTALALTAALQNGFTYYAQQSSNHCASERVPLTVVILEEELSEIIGCEKFKPLPGATYVISGWVREQGVNAIPAETIAFNNSSESALFVQLLNHLKDKLLLADGDTKPIDVPLEYIPTSADEVLNFDALIPFINGITTQERRLTVHKFERLKDDYGRTIGFQFYLNEGETHLFEYRTPEVTVPLYPGTFLSDTTTTFNYPLLGNGVDILNFTSAQVISEKLQVGQQFKSTSPPEIDVNNSVVISNGGIKESITVFNYEPLPNYQPIKYVNNMIRLEYEDADDTILLGQTVELMPKGKVIDGWQRISAQFTIPGDAALMTIQLQNNAEGDTSEQGLNVYFDDLRVLPIDGNIKTFVYHPETQRLMAELDENNYATYYEYDEEGGLIRVKKETERGVYTIQETRSGNAKE